MDPVEGGAPQAESAQETSVPELTSDYSEYSNEQLDQILSQPEAGEEEPAVEAQPARPEPASPEPQKAEEPKQPEAKPQERNVTSEEHTKVLQQLEQARLWSARRSNEIGELRKQNKQLIERLNSNLREVMDEDPVAGAKQLRHIENAEQQIAALDHEEAETRRIVESQNLFFNYVKPDEVSVDDMCESLRRDGINEQFIAQFRSNPWLLAHGETMVHLGKRAFAEKLVMQAASRIEAMEAEIAELKKRPQQVLEGVNRALKQKPQVTASGGKPAGKSSLNPRDLSSLSDAELDEILQNSD